jgi:hypothetical protein
MKIEVKISQYLKKYIEYKHPKKITFRRSNIYAMLFFAEWKFRGKQVKNANLGKRYNLNATIDIHISETEWQNQYLKKEPADIVYTSFNRIIRNFFYEEYFIFMDLRLLKKQILNEHDQLIKELAIEFMDKLRLSDDDILLETLLRNYRRYRLNPNLDLYDLIESLHDDNSIATLPL